jgi:hypothetical protein
MNRGKFLKVVTRGMFPIRHHGTEREPEHLSSH